MTKQITRFGILALSVLGAILLLTVFTAGVGASTPAAPAPNPDSASLTIVASTPITLPSPSWRIGITADGLYRLSYEKLDAAGVPTDMAPSAYHLIWRGQEVALEEISDGDSAFEPGEAFLFYAEKFHGSTQDEKYTDENVYWLTVDAGSPGLRMEARTDPLHDVYLPLVLNANGGGGGATEPPWYTATIRAEENLVHWARWSQEPGTDTTWFWERITTDGIPVTRTYHITLTEPVSTTYSATLLIEVAGRSYYGSVDPDHHLRLAVNDATADDVTWDGQVGAVFTLTIPSSALVGGVNQVDVTILTDAGCPLQDIYVDRIEISYRRAYVAEEDQLTWTAPSSGVQLASIADFSTANVRLYDITHPLTPTRLVSAAASSSGTAYTLLLRDQAPAGTAYLAVAEPVVTDVPTLSVYYPPSDLISPTTGADEIIIAHGDFITAIQPLADRRRAQGLRVRVVDVEDVYALFNGGVVHPEAIRSFVAHAYANWPGRPPSLLLLVGDGNFNPKGYNPASYGAFVPTKIPPYLEFADPDQGEVPVDSRYGDVDWGGMPEVAVGRIPANSAAEVEGVVDKIIAYENATSAAWMDRVLHVADDGEVSNEGYSQVLDGLAQDYLPTGVETRTVYLEDYCTNPSYSPCPSATLALTQTWSAGGALLSYAGHGAVHRWTHEPLLLNTQLQSLTGTVGLPFVISLDCWDGYWMFPSKYPHPSLAGQNLHSTGEWATTVLTDRGAIAVFGPAGLGYIGVEKWMVDRMYQAMFQEGNFQLGLLTQEGREEVYWNYMARTYTLFGDPALYLPWWDHIAATPTAYTMTVGTSIPLSTTFTVTGTTRFGQDFVVTPTWTANAGTIDGWGYYTAPNSATTVQLAAHMGVVSTTVAVTVVEGESGAMTAPSNSNDTAMAQIARGLGPLQSGLLGAALANFLKNRPRLSGPGGNLPETGYNANI